MKSILIFTYFQRHLKKMLPIINELEKDTDIKLYVVLMTSEEKEIAEKNNIKYHMLDEFSNIERCYDFDLDWGLQAIINAINLIEPDLFVAIEVNYILRNVVRYCKQINIKSIIVQHGTPNKHSLHAFLPFEGNLFLAWGEFTKRFLVDNGMDEEKIFLTGGVSFDRTITLIPDKDKISKIINADSKKKWILFTTQCTGPGGIPTEEEIEVAIKSTAEYIKKYEEYELLFQVHPSQDIDFVKDLVHSINSNCFVGKYPDTEELIKVSDGIITFFSTTAIDAILLYKPLYLINLSEDRDFYPFKEMGVACVSLEVDQIENDFDYFLNKFTIDQEKYNITSNFLNYRNDGKALDRVVEIIKNY